MRNLSSMFSLFFRLHAVIVLLLVTKSLVASMVMVQPSADCNSCNGLANLTLSQGGFADVFWSDESGAIIQIDLNVSGVVSLGGLCIGQYSVQINPYSGVPENLAFSIGIPGFSPGISGVANTCVGGGTVNLVQLLGSDATAGGTWLNPQGSAVVGVFNPNSSLPGLYTYQISGAGCLMQATVQVSVNQNADPGISTTYLICENYTDFSLISALFGQPDDGGVWFGPNFEIDDGFYSPSTDNSGIYTYMIDTVPGCAAVFSTLFVMENQIPNSGLDATIEVCPTATPFNMIDYLGGSPQSGGQWFYDMIQSVGPVFNPATSPAGVYRYQVNGVTPCPNTFSFLTISFTDGITAGSNGSAIFCEIDNAVNMIGLLGGVPDSGGTWSGPQGVVQTGIFDPSTMPSGVYTYTVDAMGCQPESAQLDVQNVPLPSAGSDVVFQICELSLPLDLSQLIQGNSSSGTFFFNGAAMPGSVPDLLPGDFVFDFEIDGGVCPDDVAVIQITVHDLLPDPGSVEVNVCTLQGTVDLSQYSAPFGMAGVWMDEFGVAVPSAQVTSIGPVDVYHFVVPSQNTCPDDSLAATINVFAPAFDPGIVNVRERISVEFE